jgi:hypothetical protein
MQDEYRKWRGKNAYERALEHVDRSGDCWVWTGYVDAKGYGRMTVNRRGAKAHRFFYEWLVGPVDGPTLDHLCNNTSCVRPDHLKPATVRENVSRGGYAARSECKYGHPLDGVRPTKCGPARYCKTCNTRGFRRWKSTAKSLGQSDPTLGLKEPHAESSFPG